MNQTINAFFKLYERSKVRYVSNPARNPRTDGISQVDSVPRIVLELLHSQADPFFDCVHAKHLYVHLLAFLEHPLRTLSAPRPGDLRDMNQAFDAGFQLDENPIIGDR